MTSALPPGMIDGVRGLNGTRRFLAFGAVAVALIVMWTMYRYADQPTLVTLYRGLELREAAAMADALTKGSIAFELTSGGTEILVPAAAVAQARVAIAKQGIRADGEKPGNELLDGPNWGRTESEMKSLERRALEGELAKTLEQLHGIERAAVHLGVPETSALRKLDRPAKASVVITARGGRALSSEEVASITYLVANAVQALDPVKGRVRVEVRSRPATVPGTSRPGILVTVRDDGVGIPPEHQVRLFEPDFSTKSSGTGLGLAICRRILVDLGGEIRIESAPGTGTTVSSWFPASVPEDAPPAQAAEA